MSSSASSSAPAAAASSASAVSTPSTLNLQELLSVCYDLSISAGEAIRRIFDSGHLGAVDKDAAGTNTVPTTASGGVDFGSINDPQTLADLESQKILIGNLVRIYGTGLRIVGEEGELEQSTGEGALFREARKDLLKDEKFPAELLNLETKHVTLWIDPLDGTKEFTLGFVNYVTILIGISYKGRAIAGVVGVPFYGGKYVQKHDPLNPTFVPAPAGTPVGKTIYGAVGLGVRGSKVADLSAIPEDRKYVTTTRSHYSPELQSLLASMKPNAVIRCGGAGSKGLLVLSGDADAYVYPQTGTKRWDTCAIDGLIKAVGGKFTDQYGDEIEYDASLPPENQHGLLATLKNHHLYVLPKNATADKKSNL